VNSSILVTFLVLLIIGLGLLIYFLFIEVKKLSSKSQDGEAQKVLMEWLKEMRGSVEGVKGSMDKNTDTLNLQLREQNKQLSERLDNAARVILDVQKSITDVGREVGGVREIGHYMKDLQDMLRGPKLRGNIGEQVMADLLGQILPHDSYTLQYGFKDGQKCDAVVRIGDHLIPVDAKFPLENYLVMTKNELETEKDRLRKDFERDVKKHIESIAKKYILPNEGTTDLALMYIPNEAVYYEIAVNSSELQSFSWQKRVLPVSPNTFYAFLQTVLLGLQGKRLEEQTKLILSTLKSLSHDSEKFGGNLDILIKHVTNAKNSSDLVLSNYNQLNQRLISLNSLESPTQPTLLDS